MTAGAFRAASRRWFTRHESNLEAMSVLDPAERAQEKQASRDEDARALASGAKSADQLRSENGRFSFGGAARYSLRGASLPK